VLKFSVLMYTTVAPPDQRDADSSEKAVRVGESPPAGVSESNWKVHYYQTQIFLVL
jgi:hypothetical protein